MTATPVVPDAAAERRAPRIVRSPIVRLVVKRVLLAVPIVIGVSLLTFWVLSLVPGNAAQQLLGIDATPQQVRTLELRLGLDESGPERYLSWLQAAVTGDLGTSMVGGQPVTELLGSRLPVTAEIVALAFAVSLSAAIPMALAAARRPNGVLDRISMLVSVTGLSMANYVLALLLVLVFAVELGVLPAIGYVPISQSLVGNLQSVTLPVLAIAFPLFCFYTRFLRGDLVEQLETEDYVDTARAKGVGPWRVLVFHAFRNSSFGLLTLVGLNVGTLIGGTVIIEQIFAIPGIGQLMLQAINTRDAVVVQAVVVVFAVVAVVANLVVDLLYAVLDPRIRYGSH
ncbi:MAG: ABC transporter permease [Nocardioidaceae bacterium]